MRNSVQRLAPALAVLALVLTVPSCASKPTVSRRSEEMPVRSRLSVKEVKEIVATRARANGFTVQASDPWTVTLHVGDHGYHWSAHALLAGAPGPFWLNVDDATGLAEFVMPMVHVQQKFPAGADWLVKIEQALRTTKYPVPVDTLLRTASLAGATPTGGGKAMDGRIYLEYTIREEKDSPARFEVRLYHAPLQNTTEQPLVIASELAYVDAAINRYRIVRDVD